MKHLLILLSLQAAVNADDNEPCEGIIYKGIHYDETILKTNVYFPSALTIDYTANTLIFFYDKYLALGLATLNLDTLNFQSEDLKDVFATCAAINVESKSIYLGTQLGIHKYDIRNNKVNSFAVANTRIGSIFLNKGVIYYTEFFTNALYTLENDEVTLFKDLEHTKVLDFYIDKNDDMYFTNGTGLYRQKKGTQDAVYYEGSNIGSIECLTSDINGEVFACLKDGVYAAVKDGNSLVKQLPANTPNSVTFDTNNDIIYANVTDIVRISLSNNQDCGETEF